MLRNRTFSKKNNKSIELTIIKENCISSEPEWVKNGYRYTLSRGGAKIRLTFKGYNSVNIYAISNYKTTKYDYLLIGHPDNLVSTSNYLYSQRKSIGVKSKYTIDFIDNSEHFIDFLYYTFSSASSNTAIIEIES